MNKLRELRNKVESKLKDKLGIDEKISTYEDDIQSQTTIFNEFSKALFEQQFILKGNEKWKTPKTIWALRFIKSQSL